MQGIEGHGFYGNCVVPIIENTARECELTDRLRQAIKDYPQANAVLVRRHGGCMQQHSAASCWGAALDIRPDSRLLHPRVTAAKQLWPQEPAHSQLKGVAADPWPCFVCVHVTCTARVHPPLTHQPYPPSLCCAPRLAAGVYVWGKDWIQAKTQAECYDYLFEAAVKMAQLGINASVAPPPPLITANGAAVPEGKRHAENGVHAGEEAWQGLGRGGGG